jgi:membrane protease YdiL (CAAX protease family)
MPPIADARSAALLEVAAVVTVNILVHRWLRGLGLGMALSASGILVTLALATWLLRRRGLRWHDLGFRRPGNVGTAIVWGLGLFLLEILLLPAIVGPLSAALDLPPQDLGAFAGLKGNTPEYLLLLLPITWGTAAFGEELVYRGFILRRLSDLAGRTGVATAIAVIAQAALFAFGHTYLGPRGMLNAGAIGIVAGAAFVAGGRNLWPLILAHGLVDTVGITALYLGVAHN